jgi:cyclohexa-1,5-dienecarbonyl-CoA hydratase
MALKTEKKPRVTCIAIEHPPVNVLGIQLLRELDQELSACAADNTTDVVVIRGAGTRAFSAGMEIRDHTRDKVPEMLEIVHSVIRKLLALPQVTIAAVRGVCFGGVVIRRLRWPGSRP